MNSGIPKQSAPTDLHQNDHALIDAAFGTVLTKEKEALKDHFVHVQGPTGIVLHRDETYDEPISVTIDSAYSHLVIVAEDEAQARVCVTIDSDITSHVQEVIVGENASVEVITLTRTSRKNAKIVQRTKIGANASFTARNATIGGDDLSHDIVSRMEGERATSTISWLFAARRSEKASLSARNIYAARNVGGEMTMKGIAEERGRVNIDGMIDIEETGTGTDTYLTQDVLMLDPTAKVDAVPGLTINTNDVKASHSATVSRVTAEDLFYFAARGIHENDARRMYIEGYVSAMIEEFPDVMKKRIGEMLFGI